MGQPSNLGDLVHDARNPLNRIAMSAELAKLLVEQGGSSDKVVENLNEILKACGQCSHQLNLISEYSIES